MKTKLLFFFSAVLCCLCGFAQPVITVQPVGTTICEYESLALQVQATGDDLSYQWFHNGDAMPGANSPVYVDAAPSVQAGGTYYCWVINSVGLVETMHVTVLVNEGPKFLGQPPAELSVYIGDAIVLAVSATGSGISYQWQKDGYDIAGATSPSYFLICTSGADAGNYYCTVSSPTCLPVMSFYSTVTVLNLGTGTADYPGELQLFPNPASDKVSIRCGESLDSVSVDLYDLQGKLLMHAVSAQTDQTVLDISGLNTGLYLVKVASGAKTAVRKLVVQ